MLERIRQTILNNLGIKITSLILALAVYAHVYSQEVHTAVYQIPLEVAGLPRGLTFLNPVPESVRVRIRAKGSELLKLRTQPPRAVVRLEQAHEGLLQRPVTTGDVSLPPQSDAVVEAIVNPVVLTLDIEPVETAERPVRAVLDGSPAENAVLAGPVKIEPATVEILGPASLISRIDTVRTEGIPLNGRSGPFEESVPLDVPEGVRARVERVTVAVPIELLERRILGPFRVLLPADLKGRWSLHPESVLVRVAVPRNRVDVLESLELKPRAAAVPVPQEEQAVPVEVAVPARLRGTVTVESVDPPGVDLIRRGR